MTKLGTLSCILLLCVGCSSQAEPKSETLAIEQVPPHLVEIARKELPGVKFVSCFKFEQNGESVFEIRGKDKRGKICEVEVSASGKVLEIE